jgi:hypothetical protein
VHGWLEIKMPAGFLTGEWQKVFVTVQDKKLKLFSEKEQTN